MSKRNLKGTTTSSKKEWEESTKDHIKITLDDIENVQEVLDDEQLQMISKTDEALHHIEEGKKLLEQGRFTIQEVSEKLSFLMSDLWLVMERLDSIKMTFMEKES